MAKRWDRTARGSTREATGKFSEPAWDITSSAESDGARKGCPVSTVATPKLLTYSASDQSSTLVIRAGTARQERRAAREEIPASSGRHPNVRWVSCSEARRAQSEGGTYQPQDHRFDDLAGRRDGGGPIQPRPQPGGQPLGHRGHDARGLRFGP